ncbi:unnamed protein product [marine sediment metagenome]|uniref:Uncharacterized protein n=1 Tax=marine sediment metagenome TaxID=412755 RepID=X1NNV5_9ZZZZ
MYRDEIIEIISSSENKELNNWYHSNIKNLAQFLVDKLEPENNILNISAEIPEKVISK